MIEQVRILKTYSAYLKQRFGEPVLKIPVNAGFNCPNRDGTKGRGGCTFCDNGAFSPVAHETSDVLSQLQRGIKRSKHRFSKFIAYLQPNSNTHGSVQKLKNVCEPLLNVPDVVGIAVGTRPDCISSRIADYLEELSHRTYLSVELGLQTIHDETLAVINRCQTWADSSAAIATLGTKNVETIVHIMLGLPDETEQMMLETAKTIARLPIQGVKLHQLMVIRGTTLEKDYKNNFIQPLTLEQYADLVSRFIRQLRPNQVIHRLMADCSESQGLIAPQWSADKAKALNIIRKALQNHQIH